MPAVESSPARVWRRGPAVFSECDAHPNVVWVRGTQYASTRVALWTTVGRAIAFDDTDGVIDSSQVN